MTVSSIVVTLGSKSGITVSYRVFGFSDHKNPFLYSLRLEVDSSILKLRALDEY